MRKGDKWELYVPSELAYGDSAKGAVITPGSVLVFELELLDVQEPKSFVQEFFSKYAERFTKINTVKRVYF